MQGAKKSSLHGLYRHPSADTKRPVNTPTNPFDSDDEFDYKKTLKTSGRTSSEPSLFTSSTNPFEDEEVKGSYSYQSNSSSAKHRYKNDFRNASSTNPFEDEEIKGSSSSQRNSSSAKNRYKNDFRNTSSTNPIEDEEIKENQSMQELENYAVHRAEETTQTVNNCLKIAEDIREDATKTLVTLHQQGEQISKIHMVAADMDHDLSRGEKLLGSLGGIFSKTWKPKKTRPITGPVITRDDPVQRKGNHLEQRERLGLTSASKERLRTPLPEPTNAMQKVEVEKVKQDDALSDLSNILGDLKEMVIDMGSEIDRQNKAMDHVQDDVDELNFRVKGANQRTRRLLGK